MTFIVKLFLKYSLTVSTISNYGFASKFNTYQNLAFINTINFVK